MRSFIASTIVALAALPAVLAVPLGIQPPKFFNCSVKAKPTLPTGQATIAVDNSLTTQFVGLGVGVQNYTCGADGKFASAGAVAKLYDVSCAYGTPLFSLLPDLAIKFNFDRPKIASEIGRTFGRNPAELGDHYFITKPDGSGIAPKFDFTASQKKSSFVVAAKVGNVPSPQGSANVDWLQLKKTDGTIGTQVFRIDTRKGQPAASCTAGATASVKYSAMYWFLA